MRIGPSKSYAIFPNGSTEVDKIGVPGLNRGTDRGIMEFAKTKGWT
jgi:hypothetical protein